MNGSLPASVRGFFGRWRRRDVRAAGAASSVDAPQPSVVPSDVSVPLAAPDLPAPPKPLANHGEVEVPIALRIAAAYGWRLLVVAAASAGLIWLVVEFKLIIIPLLIGVLLTALVYPGFSIMLRHRVPRVLAVVISVVGTLAIIFALVWLVVWQLTVQASTVRERLTQTYDDVHGFIIDSGFATDEQLSEYFSDALRWLQQQADTLLSGVLAVGLQVGQVGAGLLLTMFVLLCLLFDGRGIWQWTVRLFPRNARYAVNAAAQNGWRTLIQYARVQILVATINGVGIGLGALVLGVPLAIPIAVVVFLGAFVPFIGAIVTGFAAVLIALAYNGPLIAVLMLAVVLTVQQVEAHVLQPLLMGAAVKVHPLAVVLVVTGGTIVGGVAGALFAVPIAAFVNVVAVTLSTGSWRTGERVSGDLIWSTVPKSLGRGDEDEE